MMDKERWERMQSLFHAAAGLSAGERDAFLRAECGDDHALRADVRAMLEEDARAASVLDRDVAEVAHEVFDGEGVQGRLPETFGPYRVRKLLGEGGMGVVLLGEREDLHSLAAIKILRDAWLSPARRERFAAEQRTLAGLSHPSIARLFDADTLPDGTPYFVMEYVEGSTLTRYCGDRSSSIEERLRLFRTVCEAVQYAHRQAIVHRDLKPSNILVKADGSVRLLDFGIARQLEGLNSSADRTRTGLRLMTPAYAAPEQLRGGHAGIQTDVYSLGVVLYELLAERLPFDLSNRTPGEAELLVVEGAPEKPSVAAGAKGVPRAGKAASADLDVLCLTAMHKDVRKRYPSVEALIRDIDHYLKGEPLEARPDTLGYRLGKFVRRNRRAVAVAAVVLAAVVGLAGFFTVRLAAARDAAVAEAARTERVQRFMLNLFEGGDAAAGPAEYLRVVTLIERGVREARALDGEPQLQAELYQTLGGLMQKLGKLDQAGALLNSALEQRQSLFGADHPAVAESLVALGVLRSVQANYEEAEALVRDGLSMSSRHLPPDHPAVAKATAALGRVLEDRGHYDQAIPVLEEAVRLQSRPGVPPGDLAVSLTELANSHFYSGNYELSESLNRRVLALDRQMHGERHPNVADDLINLGAIEFERGRYTDAERYYREALDILQSWHGKDHQETASALTILSRALIAQERMDEAAALLGDVLRIQERVYGEVHPRVASALNELGHVARRQRRFDDAEAHFRRMADIYRSVHDNRHHLIGIALSNLAGVIVDRKDYPRAERHFREALGSYDGTLPPDNLNVGITRVRLGGVLLLQRRYGEAESELLAGWEILRKQTTPSHRWVGIARKELVSLYTAINRPERVAEFREEAGGGE